jgi:hypothetical protein
VNLNSSVENRLSLKIFITVFLLIALHASPEGPQNARYLNLVQSIVEFGTFSLQKGYMSHVDTLEIGGKIYSVIPPGISIILAPLYFIYRPIASSLGFLQTETYWAIFSILTTIFVVAPMLGLIAVLMFKLLGRFTEDIPKRLWLVFIFIFGSPIFFYGTYGIWSHAYTMSALFTAFYLTVYKKNSFLIGLCLGLSLIFDYAAAIPISLIGGFWLYTHRKLPLNECLKQLILLSLGFLLILGFIFYYNYTITGSVFKTPNSIFLKDIKMFLFPSFASLWGLSFSPYRGIFLYFPMIFLVIPSVLKKVYEKNEIALFSLVFIAFIYVFNLTYYAWSGDVCFGPRHLVNTIPFIIIAIVSCDLKYIKLLGCLSIFINLAGVSTIPSDNLFMNIIQFIYRGPFLQWQSYLYKVFLPQYFNIHLSLMTPFFIYVLMGFIIYLIWTPREMRREGEGEG